MIQAQDKTAWQDDCAMWRGTHLNGMFSHWCPDWDGLPIDETCWGEWPCACAEGMLKELLKTAETESFEQQREIELDCLRRWKTILNKVLW